MQYVTSKKRQEKLGNIAVYAILLLGAFIIMLPVAWMFSTALKDSGSVFLFPPDWIPNPVRWDNFGKAIAAIPFWQFLQNTLTITLFAVIGQVCSAALVGFGFARLDFPGRNILFLLVLSTMMLPGLVTTVPVFMMFKSLGWINTFLPLIVPSYFGGRAYYIFVMRQFFMSTPLELDEAARIDGCGTFKIFLHILVPLAKPALLTVGILNFMNHWSDFMGPLIYLNDTAKYTLSLGLNLFRGMYQTDWNLLMAATILVMIPSVILFFLAQKQFVQGIVVSGVKG